MGSTHRFLALKDDLLRVYAWFSELSEPPTIVRGRGCQFLHFATEGFLHDDPKTGQVDVKRSPIASLFPPEKLRGVLWTAGELHFLPTPLREHFPALDAISRGFGKWLREFDCVYDGPGTSSEWGHFLEGGLQNYDPPIFALPDAMAALRAGQYFVAHGFDGGPLNRLCRTLELRGVRGRAADT